MKIEKWIVVIVALFPLFFLVVMKLPVLVSGEGGPQLDSFLIGRPAWT